MPCDTISTVSLELKNANRGFLKKAVESLGFTVSEDADGLYWRGGRYERTEGQIITRDEEAGRRIKRLYTGEVVKHNATRFGWRVKQVSENKFQVQRG